MQIESDDKDELDQIFESLKQLSEKTDSSEKRKVIVKAAREVKKFLVGKNTDFDAVLSKVGELIDEANRFENEIKPTKATETENVDSKEESSQSTDLTEENSEVEDSVSEDETTETQNEDVENIPEEDKPDELSAELDKSILNEFIVESRELLEDAGKCSARTRD